MKFYPQIFLTTEILKIMGICLKKNHWELPETKRDFLAINIYFIINFLLVKESYLMILENQRSISRNVKSVV